MSGIMRLINEVKYTSMYTKVKNDRGILSAKDTLNDEEEEELKILDKISQLYDEAKDDKYKLEHEGYENDYDISNRYTKTVHELDRYTRFYMGKYNFMTEQKEEDELKYKLKHTTRYMAVLLEITIYKFVKNLYKSVLWGDGREEYDCITSYTF